MLRIPKMKNLNCLLILLIISILGFTGCKEEPAIGDVVDMAPITALVFEPVNIGGEISQGVYYREINNINKLIASNEALLIGFLGRNPPSSAAMPFLEILCDDFAGKLQIVRVNVEMSDNEDDVVYLKSLFDVKGSPHFVLVSKGQIINEFSGYDEEINEKINVAVSDFVYRMQA